MTFADIVFTTFEREVTEEDLDNPGAFSTVSIPISAARNEVPLFLDDPASLFEHPVLGFTNIKIARSSDGSASVKLPMSDYFTSDCPLTGLAAANVACIRYKNYKYKGQSLASDLYRYDWYYVTGYRELTNKSEEDPDYPNDRKLSIMDVEVDLQLIPFTTYMQGGTVANMIPERMPVPTDHVRQNWTQSIMTKGIPSTALPSLPKSPKCKSSTVEYDTLWCEVITSNTAGIRKYGLFVAADINIRVRADETGTKDGVPEYFVYPTLAQLVEDPDEYLDLTAGTTIHDINISEFCPYKTVQFDEGNFTGLKITANNAAETAPARKEIAGVILGQTQLYYAYCSYIVSDQNDIWDVDYHPPYDPNTGSMTITLTDFEKENGQIVIKDSLRNDVLTVPMELNDNTMTIDYRVYADTSNIYLSLKYGDIYKIIAGYKVPWSTTSWDQYRAFNLQYDRQALQNDIDMTNKEMNAAIINGMSNAVIGGAMTGAMRGGPTAGATGLATGLTSLGSTAISAALNRSMTVEKLNKDQELTEMRMKGGPGTINNPSQGYGFVNGVRDAGGAELLLLMPKGLRVEEWQMQTGTWGYPSNKVMRTLFLDTEGYWKGRMYPTFTEEVNDTAVRDAAIRQLEDGFYLVPITYE